jgi:hypothetical protein
VNWWLIVGGAVIAFIGGSLIHEGDTNVGKALGWFLVLNAGMLISFGANIPAQAGWIKPDQEACVYYVFVEDVITCVPYGQEG